jgi:hypothetical protein
VMIGLDLNFGILRVGMLEIAGYTYLPHKSRIHSYKNPEMIVALRKSNHSWLIAYSIPSLTSTVWLEIAEE